MRRKCLHNTKADLQVYWSSSDRQPYPTASEVESTTWIVHNQVRHQTSLPFLISSFSSLHSLHTHTPHTPWLSHLCSNRLKIPLSDNHYDNVNSLLPSENCEEHCYYSPFTPSPHSTPISDCIPEENVEECPNSGFLTAATKRPTAFFSCASHVVAPDSPWGEIKRILEFGEEFRILRHGLISDPIFAESSPTITYLQMLVLIIYLVWMNEIWYSSQSHLEFSIFFPSVTLLVLARLLFMLALSSPASW